MNNLPQLTMEDLNFLKGLAKQLREQPNYATAKPLVFQIQEKFLVPGFDENFGEMPCIVDEDCKMYVTPESVVEMIEEYYLEENQTLEALAEEVDHDLDCQDLFSLYELSERMEWGWKYTYCQEAERFSGAFLTEEAAEQHLQANYYHYHGSARVYCKHGWRNPELEQLLAIVEKFDC